MRANWRPWATGSSAGVAGRPRRRGPAGGAREARGKARWPRAAGCAARPGRWARGTGRQRRRGRSHEDAEDAEASGARGAGTGEAGRGPRRGSGGFPAGARRRAGDGAGGELRAQGERQGQGAGRRLGARRPGPEEGVVQRVAEATWRSQATMAQRKQPAPPSEKKNILAPQPGGEMGLRAPGRWTHQAAQGGAHGRGGRDGRATRDPQREGRPAERRAPGHLAPAAQERSRPAAQQGNIFTFCLGTDLARL